MYCFRISCIIFYCIYLQEVNCFFSKIIIDGFDYFKCSLKECCNEYHIKKDVQELNKRLREKLFGQHIAHEVVISALSAHTNLKEPVKALVMSFHGPGGTGKNYVARMIVDTFYARNENSDYVHFFNGRINFPLETKREKYKEDLMNIVIESLLKCPESLFIFDEVDMIIPGVLDILVPFIEYGIPNVWYKGQKVRVISNKAIFIFLSNIGSQNIVAKLLEFWNNGKVSRDQTKLVDFEHLISKRAFNEHGGFHKSNTIQAHLIDHYVPFLPLEKNHVEQCIDEAFKSKGKAANSSQIKEIMEYISFGPETHKLFAKGGCKRIDIKVVNLLYRQKFRNEL